MTVKWVKKCEGVETAETEVQNTKAEFQFPFIYSPCLSCTKFFSLILFFFSVCLVYESGSQYISGILISGTDTSDEQLVRSLNECQKLLQSSDSCSNVQSCIKLINPGEKTSGVSGAMVT